MSETLSEAGGLEHHETLLPLDAGVSVEWCLDVLNARVRGRGLQICKVCVVAYQVIELFHH